MFDRLIVNSVVEYFGEKYRILSLKFPKVVMKRDNSDGEAIEVSFFHLIDEPSFNFGTRLKKALTNEINNGISKYKSSLDTLSNKEREKVTKRFEVIRPIIVFEGVKNNDIKSICEFMELYKEFIHVDEKVIDITRETLIERIGEKSSISKRTLKRYLAAYRRAELEWHSRGQEGLISKAGDGHFSRKDNKKLEICHPKYPDNVLDVLDIRIDEKYIPILKEVIETKYLTKRALRVSAIYEEICTKCASQDLKPPLSITIYKLLERIDGRITESMRQGKKAIEKYEDIERGFTDNEALYPLHVVEIDHTELDLIVIDKDTGQEIARPWITLGIDLYTRMVWCMYVSFEPPSINRVRKALQHGIFFKRTKEKYNTNNEWEICGIPKIIQLDNGPEFKSIEVRRIINETLQSNVRYRPVRTPRYGGTIERLFGTINSELIHNLRGTTKSNYKELGDYKPGEDALLTLEDIIEILTRYIVDIYHFSEHKGLPLEAPIPIARYYTGMESIGFPEFIPRDEEEYYRRELLSTTERPYTRDGVRLENVLYKSEKLTHLINKRVVKYKIKHDIDDISKIFLLEPETREYIELLAVNPNFETLVGMNRYTYKQLRKLKKEKGELLKSQIPGTKLVEQAKKELADKIQKEYNKNKKLRIQNQRMGAISETNKTEGSPHASKEMSVDEMIKASLIAQQNLERSE